MKYKEREFLHIFIISTPISAMVAYEYIHEKNIDKKLIKIITLRNLSFSLLSSFNVIVHKKSLFQKIANKLSSKYFSQSSIIRRKIEINKKNFILYIPFLSDLALEITKSENCKGHIYLEEGEQSYKNFLLFPNSKSYNRVSKKEVGEYKFTDYYREDGLQWIGITRNSFPTAPKSKKYILKSFRHVKKKYVPYLRKYINILLLPTPARLPRQKWKIAVKKLAKNINAPFALKLHPAFENNAEVRNYFNSILKDLGYSNSIICNGNVIIEAEMLFSKKILVGDRSSLFRYANLLGSSIKKINFLWKKPETVYLKHKF